METLNDIEITQRLIETDNRFDYFIPNYLVKGLKPRSKVCSVGCGMGYDVEAHGHRYNFITEWPVKKPKLRLTFPFHPRNFVVHFRIFPNIWI